MMCYTYNMEKTEELAQVDNEIIVHHLVKAYEFRLENPKASWPQACEELGIPYKTLNRWLGEGYLQDYIASIRTTSTDTAVALALEALPDIVQKQIDIATMKVVQKGVSPTAAAKFIMDLVGDSKERGKKFVQNNYFMPIPPDTVIDP